MTAAVEAITDVAQLHIGHALTLNVEQVAVADLVRGVAQRMAMAYQKGATPVEVAAPPTPRVAPADRVRLERVLQNIIGNAIN